VSTGSPGELAWDALRLTEPGGRSLSGASTAVIRRGERVLVTGEPAALASLFKALAGLWPWGTGTIRLPPDERVESLPQQPFLPAGSLAAALEYPDPPGTHAAPALHRALECAGVAWLAPRLTEAADWDHLLPLRTRQHLAVARALLHEPAWLVVEDAAGGADPRGDGLTLDMLRHELPGATLVTLSSSPELAGRHQRTVLLPPGAPAGRSPDQA
jgi:putative ATP-binding cassette transporter